MPDCKTTSELAVKLAQAGAPAIPQERIVVVRAALAELACPIVSTPVGCHERLPYGMQIIGRPFSEALLLRIATAFEQRSDAIPPPPI